MEAEAKAAIQRDIERRERNQRMHQKQLAEAEAARQKPWSETLAGLLSEEKKINRQFAMHLGALKAACEAHIALQEKAGNLATAHGQRNPIVSVVGGENIPTSAEFYIKLILNKALAAIKSGAGLTLDGLSQPR
jgi:hypothetical protein